MMTRKEILNEVENIVCKDRNEQYGEPEDNFKHIAEFWSTYLEHEIVSTDVANMMILFKVARNMHMNPKLDNFIDIAGYAACGGELIKRRNNVYNLWKR